MTINATLYGQVAILSMFFVYLVLTLLNKKYEVGKNKIGLCMALCFFLLPFGIVYFVYLLLSVKKRELLPDQNPN